MCSSTISQSILRDEELYRTVVEFTSELAILRSPDKGVLYISPNCENITGYHESEFYADPDLLDRLIHTADRQVWSQHVEFASHGRSPFPIDFRIVTKSGCVIWLSHSCHPVFAENGEFLGTRGSYRDVTERKLMEDELREEKEFVEHLINNATVPIFVIDASHRVMIWNRACEELTGLKGDEVVGTDGQWRPFYEQRRPTLSDLVIDGRSDELSRYYKLYSRSTLIAEGLQAEGWYPNLGGRARYIFFNAAPIRNRKGELVAAIETLQDITDRKQAEKRLRESQSELLAQHDELNRLFTHVEIVKKEWERTLDCIDDLVILVDSQGRIRRCNRSVSLFTGRTYLQILGMEWRELLLTQEMDTSRLAGQSGELFHLPSSRWFYLAAYPFKRGDELEVSGAVITLHDTTELKLVTEALEKAYAELQATQAQMLQQEKMASIGQLSAGVAHEINNPIGFVASNLGTLDKYVGRIIEFITFQQERLDPVATPELRGELQAKWKELKLDYILEDTRQLIRESLDGTGRVRKIVQDLKTFSRMDQADFKPADINDCINSTINIVWNEIKYKASLNRELGDIPRTMCYPQQLNQVFMNLLVNAAHAIEKQGEITVRSWHSDGWINVSVSDTGSGIAAEHLSRIFEPFFTTKEVGTGTGLGLSISYDIVKRHNGEIAVVSDAGKGTTFTVRIPVVEGE